MEFLQIRRKGLVETNYMRGVTHVIVAPDHIDNAIYIHFGGARPSITICFAKEDYGRTVRLHNELLKNIFGGYTTGLVIELDENNLVHQWWWHTSDEFDELLLAIPEKQYRVRIDYETNFEVDVTAANESEAYRKALEKRSHVGPECDSIAEQLIENTEESGREVTEIK